MIYAIEETNLKRQQLLAEYLNPLTLRALEHLSLREDAKVLDAGCGFGETTHLLAERFPGTSIIGIDQNNVLIEAAKSTKTLKNPASEFLVGDVLDLPFADNSFDLVFTRYLLHHLPDPQTALNELTRVCKSGGTVFVQEPDMNFLGTYPESWAYPKLRDLATRLYADTSLGIKLIDHFKRSKLENVRHRAEAVFAGPDSSLREFYTLTASAIREALLTNGLMDEKEFDEWIREFSRVEKDPTIFILVHAMISCWGTKFDLKNRA